MNLKLYDKKKGGGEYEKNLFAFSFVAGINSQRMQ